MDSEDDMYDSYDGEYLDDYGEDYYLEEIDEYERVLEDSGDDGGVWDENEEDVGVSEESDKEGDAYNEDGGFSDDNGEAVGVSDHNGEDVGDVSVFNDEDGDVSNEVGEDEDDGDYGFVDTAADDLADPDFLSCHPQGTYTLEFDGASKGNPGKAGAGAVLRNPDGSVAHKIMKRVGVATNNVAEYEALIQGLKYAQSQGIDRIRVKGDSNLVCKQVNGDWKTRSKNLIDLNMEAKDLKSRFKEFHIDHIPRASNSEADALANDAVNLPDGK